jgi:hypothetical protein
MPSFKFHFQEIDWVIYFPSHGNEGRKFAKYGVTFLDIKKGRSPHNWVLPGFLRQGAELETGLPEDEEGEGHEPVL